MWHYTKAPVNVRAEWTVYWNDEPVADVPDDESIARLIAAAPELLRNLRQLAELVESIGHDCTPAREAIARATSED